MTFPTRLLSPGEEVYLDARPNWSYLFWPSVVLVLVLAGCVAVVALWSSAPVWMAWVLLGFGLVAFVNFLARYVGWRTKSFVVTSQRIVYRTGVLRRTGREIPIGRVQDVTYYQTVVERIVRAGSLTVESAGRHGQDPFPDITRPDEVQSLINRVVSQAAGGYAVAHGAAPVPGAQVPGASTPGAPPPVAPFPAPSPPIAPFPVASPPITDPTPRTPPPAPMPPTQPAPPPMPPTAPSPSPPPSPPVPTIAQQLGQLAELHHHGVITDAEYEHKRRELLDRL